MPPRYYDDGLKAAGWLRTGPVRVGDGMLDIDNGKLQLPPVERCLGMLVQRERP